MSRLGRRIVLVNLIGLVLLMGGIVYLNQFRAGLIEARNHALQTQAGIIARAVAETAGDDPETALDRDAAAALLTRLLLPTQTRAQLYDSGGRLVLDSWQLSAGERVVAEDLPPPSQGASDSRGFWHPVREAAGALGRVLPGRVHLSEESPEAALAAALGGQAGSASGYDTHGESIIAVAVPVQRFRAILGALMLVTRGGDVAALERAESWTLAGVFLMALCVTVLVSVLLAAAIAAPVRRLAEAADDVRSGRTGRGSIPDLSVRGDEIGDLSRALRAMTDALYERLEAIESFAADVAHELRNPLTSLRAAAESLPEASAADRTRLMAVIRDDVTRMDRLIGDISDASRIDAELARDVMQEVDVGTLLETVADAVGQGNGGVRVRVERVPGTSLRVRGFADRIGQLFGNLLDNAASFTPADGRVGVRVWREGDWVTASIEDDGPGITPDRLERVFDRFHTDRPSDSFGRHSGLGLSIARQIVAAHGGRIHAENREAPATGARFVVSLPAAGPVASDAGLR